MPRSGEVWVMRHLARLRRGRVTILGPADVGATEFARLGSPPVLFRYHGTGTIGWCDSLQAFVRTYDWLAGDENTATVEHGPQLRPGDFRIDYPIRPGTGVPT